MRRKFVLGTRTPAAAALQIQPRNATLNGTIGGGGTVIAGLPFNDGFESGNTNLWDTVGGTVTVTTAQAYEGTRSASTLATSGQQSDNYLEYNFGDAMQVGGTPTGTNEIWIRFAHKWDTNYVDTGVPNQKLMLLNMHNPVSPGRRRYQMTFNYSTNSSAYFLEFFRWNEDTTFGGSVTPNIVVPFDRVKGRWEEFVFRIKMNAIGLSNGELDMWTKAEGETSYTQRVTRTNINYRESSNFTPNRFIGLSNFDTLTTRSGSRYWDSCYIGQEAVDLSDDPVGGDNDGLIVTDFANYDPDAAEFMSLDVNSTLPNMNGFNGGIVTFEQQPWWNGGSVGVCRMRPPTTGDSRSGLGGLLTGWPLWKNATKAIRQLNFRIEVMFSDLYCQNTTQYPKYFIFQIYPELSTSPSDQSKRPMFFIVNGSGWANPNVPNSLVFAPAIGTLMMHSSTNIVPAADSADRVASGNNNPGTFGTVTQPFYIRTTSGTDSVGNPIIPNSEVVCFEVRLQMMSTAGEPGGIVGFRVYRRNGQVFERCCALNWDDSYAPNAYYIAGIDSFGGGYYNNANASSTSLWSMVGRRISIAFNYQPTVGRAWKGPPTGFVT
jgi:hypothetical protein